MTQGEKIKNAIRGRGLTMEDAADKLGISRPTLFNKLNAAEIDKEFLQNVEEKLGINVGAPERSSGVHTRLVDEIEMKYNIVPLKNARTVEIWLPKDFDKQDLKTLLKWVELKESTL